LSCFLDFGAAEVAALLAYKLVFKVTTLQASKGSRCGMHWL